jgi:hypothetical protein
MSELTPSQLHTRERVESVIRLIAPMLDVVLAAGDRISRIVEPEDYGYYPARPLAESTRDEAATTTGSVAPEA